MPTADADRFLRGLVGVLFVGLGLIAGASLLFDPFGVWRRVGLSPATGPTLTWSRIAAAERARADCDVVLLGSSRIVYGHGTTPVEVDGVRVCNAALGGTSMSELAEMAEVAIASPSVRTIVLFPELHLFHDDRDVRGDHDQSLLDDRRSALAYGAWTLFGIGAIDGLLEQQGVRSPWRPAKRDVDPVSPSAKVIRVALLQSRIYRRFSGPGAALALLVDVLDAAATRGVEVVLALPPTHALEYETLHAAGLWDTNKALRRALFRLADERGLLFLDFSRYHRASMARLPLRRGDPPSDQWLDLVHEGPTLGRATLERLRETWGGPAWRGDPAFGVTVRPGQLDATLAALDEGRRRWRVQRPEQAAWLDQTVTRLAAEDRGASKDWEINRRRSRGERVSWRARRPAPERQAR